MMLRRASLRSRAAATVSLIAVLALALNANGFSAAVAPQAEGDDSGRAGPCDPGLDLREENACDPANELPNDAATMDEITKYAGARYAGMWIDRKDPAVPIMRVGFVDNVPADQEFLDSLKGSSGRVVAVASMFSSAELQAVADAASTSLSGIGYPLIVGADAPSNAVIVDGPPTKADDVKAIVSGFLALTERLDPLAVSALNKLERADLPMSTLVLFQNNFEGAKSAADRNTYPKHAGGLRLVLQRVATGNQFGCTSGFTVTQANGNYAGLTAGHCSVGVERDRVSIGDNFLGLSGLNAYRGATANSTDSMRYPLASPAHRDDNIFVAGVLEYRDLQAPRYSVPELQNGVSLCFQGIASGASNCGTVIRADVAVGDDSGHTIRHTYIIDYPCAEGDSGGPLYHVLDNGNAKAAGVLWGCDRGFTYFSGIGYALDDINAVMYYN